MHVYKSFQHNEMDSADSQKNLIRVQKKCKFQNY